MPSAFPIGLYYFAYLGALGLCWPFFALYLGSVGLSPTESTALMAMSPALAAFAPPLVGLLADARTARVWLLRLASLGAAGAFALLALRPSPPRATLWACFLLFCACRAPLATLSDATALAFAQRRGGSYGALRLWGSLGFLVAALAGGAAIAAAGLRAMMAATTCALAVAAACAFAIPAPAPAPQPRAVRAWAHMLGAGDLWLFLVAAAAAQVAHAAYDVAFSLHLARLGFGSRFIGAAWATGVAAETVLLAFSGRLIARFGAPRLFAASVTVAAVRWLLLARVGSPAAILALAPLHGITFGTAYAGAVHVIRARAPREAETAAQGLLAAALGAGAGLGMLLAGGLLDRLGGRALFSHAATVAAAAAACGWIYAQMRGREVARLGEEEAAA